MKVEELEALTERTGEEARISRARRIDEHFRDGYRTTVKCYNGTIRIQNSDFLLGEDRQIATGLELRSFMKRVEGRYVDVYWLDDNGRHYVYLGDRYICEVVAKPVFSRARIERTPEDEANFELTYKYLSTVLSFNNHKLCKRLHKRFSGYASNLLYIIHND
jgi:hypothetical protein